MLIFLGIYFIVDCFTRNIDILSLDITVIKVFFNTFKLLNKYFMVINIKKSLERKH